MFTLTAIIEYVIISLACALLFALCSFTLLGALQQAGYGGKRYLAWLFRKGNMARSRFTLLAFLIALSSLVLGLCFSFAGKWAAYIALVPVLLFCVVWCAAERNASVPDCAAQIGGFSGGILKNAFALLDCAAQIGGLPRPKVTARGSCP